MISSENYRFWLCLKSCPGRFFYGRIFCFWSNRIYWWKEEELNQIFFWIRVYLWKLYDRRTELLQGVFKEMIGLLGRPFHSGPIWLFRWWIFRSKSSNRDRISNEKMFRKSKQARGSGHGCTSIEPLFRTHNLLNQTFRRKCSYNKTWLVEIKKGEGICFLF